MILLQKYGYSFAAGVFAAGGSFFGKLPGYLTALTYVHPGNNYLNSLIFHVFPLMCMLFCNVMNWRYFLKALQASEQTLLATVLTAATNYMLSFLLGAIFYEETFTMLSTCGCFLIVGGLWFLCDIPKDDAKKQQ